MEASLKVLMDAQIAKGESGNNRDLKPKTRGGRCGHPSRNKRQARELPSMGLNILTTVKFCVELLIEALAMSGRLDIFERSQLSSLTSRGPKTRRAKK